jgi:Raf kinase inhibitor-like YbhB/YbcL family protein
MFTLESRSIKNNEEIPGTYTCEGINISPELTWKNPPEGTGSFIITLFDPDAPKGGFVHWTLYNIPPDLLKIPENLPKEKAIAGMGNQGLTDYKEFGYGGPCPPRGRHRYYFTIYALNRTPSLPPGLTYREIQEAMNGDIIGRAEIMTTYELHNRKR